MLPLIAILGILNGLVGIMVIQRLYHDGESIVSRLSMAALVGSSVALASFNLNNSFIYQEWNHWPEAAILLAILGRLCLRLLRNEDHYPIRYSPPSHIRSH